MDAEFPPFTKTESDSARLYRETSEIAAAQDAKLDARHDLQSIMADLRSDLHRAYENAKCRIDAIDRTQKLADLANEAQVWGMYDPATLRGIPDSFIDSHGNRITRRHPMAAEAIRIREESATDGLAGSVLRYRDSPEDRL